MSEITPSEHVFSLISENLSLDFTNTVGGRWRTPPHGSQNDYLTSYADLVAWGQQAGLVAATEVAGLHSHAQQQPALAQAVLTKAVEWREAIYRIFYAISQENTPASADLDTLNHALSEVMPHARLVMSKTGISWDWQHEEIALDRMLWPVVRSAADLLTSEQLHKVRMCANDTCGWLFLDLTRNHSRQWCDMKDCGNRAKARRHYQRKRTASNPAIL